MGCTESRDNRSYTFDSSMLTDFTKYYKYIRKKLMLEDFKFKGFDDISLMQKLCKSHGITQEVARNWISMYIDYMILAGWNVLIKAGVFIYPPYAIQQVLKIHLCETRNYLHFCRIVTENKGAINYTPFRIAGKQTTKRMSVLKHSYNLAKTFLKENIYSNSEFCSTFEKLEQIDDIWEEFEITLMQNEFSFYFHSRESKEAFQQILTDNSEELKMQNQGPDEILRIQRRIRELLGLVDLLPETGEDYKPEVQLGAQKRIPTDLIDMSFPVQLVNTLAWEQRISVQEAKDWITEYKKFLVLVYLTDGRTTLYPSEIISRVWRLHVQFFRNYRKDARTFIANFDFSDEPDTTYQKKYYNGTLKAYEAHFGQYDTDIWPQFEQKLEETGRFASYYLAFAKNCLAKNQYQKVIRKRKHFFSLDFINSF